jgi:UDP-GlcNAc:undecaprenyl-phosphate/decaprenyl-phosphate GlcNAc-1-phosphate transferase
MFTNFDIIQFFRFIIYHYMQYFLLNHFVSILTVITAAVLLALILNKVFYWLATKFNIYDDPKSAKARKFQLAPVPLIGGSGAALAAIIIMSLFWALLKNNIITQDYTVNLAPFKLIYVVIACLSMLIIGYLDDKYQLSPKMQFLSILFSISLVVFLGEIRITSISQVGEIGFWVSILITFTWLGFATASTKFLDGHDGLVTSVGIINFLTIASVSLTTPINQPLIFIFSIIWAVCLVTYLFYNFPNAKSYLGEGASELIGFMIGVLAILSGAKLATALSILGWFIIDIFLVWAIRISQGRNPITSADRNHWHYRLMAFGLNKIQVLVITWILLIISSQIGVYGDNNHKLVLIISQGIILVTIYFYTPKQLTN